MPRPRKNRDPEFVQSLSKRASAVTDATTLQLTPLDEKTFGRVVEFIEGEGCSLSEGLRRAVRIGVEALLMDRIVPEDSPAHSYIPEISRPSHRIGTPRGQYSHTDFNSLLPTAEPEDYANVDYANTAPPGLM